MMLPRLAGPGFRRFVGDEGRPSVDIGDYPLDGGISGVFGVEWFELDKPCPELQIFEDALPLFAAMVEKYDLLNRLIALGESYTPEALCQMLLDLGFTDRSPVWTDGGEEEEGDHDA